MDLELPKGWIMMDDTSINLPFKFHKMFPDGTDVIVEIRKTNNIAKKGSGLAIKHS